MPEDRVAAGSVTRADDVPPGPPGAATRVRHRGLHRRARPQAGSTVSLPSSRGRDAQAGPAIHATASREVISMPSSAVEVRPRSDPSNVDGSATLGFEDVRQRLFGVAFHVLGRAADAEDIVQEVWIRWQGADRTHVRDRVGFLVTVTRRAALNAATSARARREVSVGDWHPQHDVATVDPQLRAERDEAVALALALLLDRLSPVERAVYVLREAFAYPFREIGEALAISEANARQVARRARGRLAGQRRGSVDPGEGDELRVAFLAAARAGDVAGLVDLLTDAVGTRSARCPAAVAPRFHAGPDRMQLRTRGRAVADPARCAPDGTCRSRRCGRHVDPART